MDIRKLQRVIVDGLEDVKAQDIVVFNTEHLSPLFERVIVASGTSNRQTKSLAASVRDAVKASGQPPPRTEGEANGEWIIVDCGAAVVHVMQPAIREYYHLEELWGEKPVKMKLASASPRLVKAEPVDETTAPKSRLPARRNAPDKPEPARRGVAKPRPAAPRRSNASTASSASADRSAPGRRAAEAHPGLGKRPASSARATPAKRAASSERTTTSQRAATGRQAVVSRVVRTVGVKSAPVRAVRAAPRAAAKKAPAKR